MHTYIALLRGINVSGQKKILMADLRMTINKLGFKDVDTYIQSGNIIFKSGETKKGVLEDRIKNGIMKDFGYDVPVLVLSGKDIVEVVDQTPYDKLLESERERVYYTLLKDEPDPALVAKLDGEAYANEKYAITQSCVYFTSLRGYGKAKFSNNFFEKKLKIAATTRNLKTMKKLIELTSA